MAATLTDAMKTDLATGNARVLLIPHVDTFTGTSFKDADKLFTTKDSLAVAEGEPTKTDIKLDQGQGQTIGSVYEIADTTVKGTVPFVSDALYNYFYIEVTGTPPVPAGTIDIDGTTYTVGNCFTLTKKVTRVSMFIESQSGNTAFILTNLDIYAVMDMKNVTTSAQSFNFTATAVNGCQLIPMKNGVPTT